MTIQLEISDATFERLSKAAAKDGVDPKEMLLKLVETNYTPRKIADSEMIRKNLDAIAELGKRLNLTISDEALTRESMYADERLRY